MNDEKQIIPLWDTKAKEDLKRIYKFNKKNFSIEFAKKVRSEIYEKAGSLRFLKQWQADEILGEPYRRILIRDYKIVYTIKDKNHISILMVFDTRQDPVKYKL